jgi:hypothetical protein
MTISLVTFLTTIRSCPQSCCRYAQPRQGFNLPRCISRVPGAVADQPAYNNIIRTFQQPPRQRSLQQGLAYCCTSSVDSLCLVTRLE